ncbi:EAL domain-containing protein [Marinibaculum pumilum]|uniref:EAL domain-containing protein n=1 Tax=Marinibaculum pumilum TaxID=1766165 RepID=A0ABV7KWV4_9PROT
MRYGQAPSLRLSPVAAAAPRFADRDHFLNRVAQDTAYAFQAVARVDTGIAHGFEALLRGVDRLGLPSIQALFDLAHGHGWLPDLERLLRRQALRAFAALPGGNTLLFLNVDARLVAEQPDLVDEILSEIDTAGLARDRFCLEISERQEAMAGDRTVEACRRLRQAGGRLALDDFGQGYSRLKLLLEQQPDYVKIDRYFISGLAQAPKKLLFLARLVDVMHVLGIQMIAEGMETEAEFRACRELGFDLAQGYLIHRPSTDPQTCLVRYDRLEELNRRERRNRSGDTGLLREQAEPLPALDAGLGMMEVFDAFRRHRDLTLFPVVDSGGVPLGVIRDVDLKSYVYSPYGRDLLANKTYGKTLRDLTRPCPTAAVETPLEKILELFAHHAEAPGVLIAERGRYIGFLTSTALLRALHEKNLAAARDQNPLTRLPGNRAVADYVRDAALDSGRAYVLAYFDFDHFKPFNDSYGFRQGDRALQLFADLMQKQLGREDVWLGHVGGDDFFGGFRNAAPAAVRPEVDALLARFRHEVESFYDPDTRRAGFLDGSGRDGLPRRYPLLRCSAGLLELPAGRPVLGSDVMMLRLAELKRAAKRQEDGIAGGRMAA